MGDFDKAIEIYSKGLLIANQIDNYKLRATFYNNLADAYLNIGHKTEMVQKYFKIALDISLKNGAWPSAGLHAANLAEEYAKQGLKSEAIATLGIAIDMLNKSPKGVYIEGATIHNIATTYNKLGQYDLARIYALRSYRILDSLKMTNNILRPLEVLTDIEIKTGKTQNATKYANKMLEVAIQKDAKIYIREAYKALSTIAKSENNFKLSLEYFEQFKRWDDSIFQIDKVRNISLLEYRAEIGKRELEVRQGMALKEKENQILAKDNQQLRSLIIAAIFALLIFLVLGGLLMRSSKRKQILNDQLIQKNTLVQKQAEEKDLLIHEIHHRVKNNLTMLQSLFYLQSKSSTDAEVKQVLTEGQTRLLSMALVHQHLYENNNESGLDLVGFIKELLHDTVETYTSANYKKIEFKADGVKLELGIKLAIPIGLILNELITNSLKYAFNDATDGKIKVMVEVEDNVLKLKYCDNGPGLPNEFDLNNAGFGFRILNLLCKQIKAEVKYKKGIHFSGFILAIPYK
jgi:two-component system, sensor histidine kinase PdtaS